MEQKNKAIFKKMHVGKEYLIDKTKLFHISILIEIAISYSKGPIQLVVTWYPTEKIEIRLLLSSCLN